MTHHLRKQNDGILRMSAHRLSLLVTVAFATALSVSATSAQDAPKPMIDKPATTGSLKSTDGKSSATSKLVKPVATAEPQLTPAQSARAKNERDARQYAQPAVDAGYPSPSQALYLAGELQLTPQQSTAIGDIATRLKSRIALLDPRIDAAEQSVAAAFQSGLPDTAKWSGALRESEKVRMELRSAYLVAHAEVGRLLTPAQRQSYIKIRAKVAPTSAPLVSSVSQNKP
jgi:Spy/CpxP family protein refolding chaperone